MFVFQIYMRLGWNCLNGSLVLLSQLNQWHEKWWSKKYRAIYMILQEMLLYLIQGKKISVLEFYFDWRQ